MKTFTVIVFAAVISCVMLASSADAEIRAAPPADFARDNGEGWYFREFAIKLGRNYSPLPFLRPGEIDAPSPLFAADPSQLRSFSPGSLSLIGDVATVNVICPPGYVSTGCIGGTVPPGISNIQFNGGINQELSGTLRGNLNAGFNVYTGCGTTVRFDYPIPRSYLRSSDTVFVKAEAYCKPISVEPKPLPVDPCSCKYLESPLGCRATSACPTGAICYVDTPGCPGFLPSQNPFRRDQFFKCVDPRRCQ